MKLELLEDLYNEQLAELYDSEKQTLRVLNKAAKTVALDELKGRFKAHAKETKQQINRLEEIMGRRGGVRAKKSKAMAGLLATPKELFKQPPADQQLCETALVAAAVKVESFESICYATLHTYAKFLSQQEDLPLLDKSFQEEKQMEDQLTTFAESLTFEAAESETAVAAPRE